MNNNDELPDDICLNCGCWLAGPEQLVQRNGHLYCNETCASQHNQPRTANP